MTYESSHKPASRIPTGPGMRAKKPVFAASRLADPDALQFKLEIGSANDVHEREADAIADAIVADDGLQGDIDIAAGSNPPGVQRSCASCAAADDEHDETLRRSTDASGRTPHIGAGLHSRISMARQQSGKSLPNRNYFESRFGTDFGSVRVHDNPGAASLSSAIGARAFTMGRDIFFGAGQLDLATKPGRHLVAHELSHTIQQTGQLGRPAGLRVQRSLAPESSMDATADAILYDVVSGQLMSISDVEDRVRALTGSELDNLAEQLASSSIDGLDDVLQQMLVDTIKRVRRGDVGQAAVLPSSRPCRAGDTKGLPAQAWTSNPTIAGIVAGAGPSKLERSSPAGAVSLVQQALIEWGCRLATPARNPLPTFGVDGDYGQETRNAIQQFQRNERLSADGSAGPKTLRALGEAVSHAEFRDSIDPSSGERFDDMASEAEPDPDGQSSLVTERFQIFGNGPTNRTSRVHIDVVGHASPRWEHPKRNSPAELNMQLSRARANEIREILPTLLGPKLDGNLDVTLESRNYEHDIPLDISASARGSDDTSIEALGDLRANDPLLRRADLDIEFVDTVHNFAGISEEGDTYETPSECERQRGRKWSLSFVGNLSVGEIVGGGVAVGNLLQYTDEGTVVRGWNLFGLGGMLGFKIPVSLTASIPNWTDFETAQPMSFRDFDRVGVSVCSGGVATPLIGYGYSSIEFTQIRTTPDVIRDHGVSFGFEAGAGCLGATFGVQGVPTCDDTRGEETAGVSSMVHSMFVDTSSFVHRSLFETGQSALSIPEAQRLNAALSAMVAEHQRLAENDNQEE
jgi:hypothetical protein